MPVANTTVSRVPRQAGARSRLRIPRPDRRLPHLAGQAESRVRSATWQDGAAASGGRSCAPRMLQAESQALVHASEIVQCAPKLGQAGGLDRVVPSRPPSARGRGVTGSRRHIAFGFEPIERDVERTSRDRAVGPPVKFLEESSIRRRPRLFAGWRAGRAARIRRGVDGRGRRSCLLCRHETK